MLLEIASQTGTSITIPSGIDTQQVTVDYQEADAEAVLFELAARVGLVPRYTAGIITLSEPDVDTNDFIVIRCGYIDPEKFRNVMDAQLGESATVELIDDRLVITAPTTVLQRAELIAQQTKSGADAWLLEVKVVNLSENMQQALGLDWSVGGSMTFSASDVTSMLDTNLLVSFVAEATKTRSGATLLDSAQLHIMEGTTSTLNRGQRIPIPRFTTTIEGATTLTGFDYVNTGFTLEATAYRVPGGVRLNLQPTISSVVGFVREAPITQQSAMTADVVLDSGEWVILTGLYNYRDTRTANSLPGLDLPIFRKSDTERGAESIQILIKATRIHRSQA